MTKPFRKHCYILLDFQSQYLQKMELFTWIHSQHNSGSRTSSNNKYSKKGNSLDTSIKVHMITQQSNCETSHCCVCPWVSIYNYAIAKPGLLDFPCLQNYANQYRLLMSVQLRMVYPSGSIKHHIIGIVHVAIGNEIHMHIVEGCHPKRKSISLNEENLI